MSAGDGVRSILEGDTDLYQFLEVEPSCDLVEIRKQYRRKALKYHPDKVGGDTHKFNLLSKVYEILSSESLRHQYDSIRQIRLKKDQDREQLLELTRQFQQELEREESKVHGSGTENDFIQKRQYYNNLELLKEEGLQRRRQQEDILLKQQQHSSKLTSEPEQPSYVSYQELKSPRSYFKFPSSKEIASYKAKIKWKFKTELKDLITGDVIKEIMEIFGPIRSINMLINENSSRYHFAVVEYTNIQDYQRALDHDYKSSASLWDGTNARKLASLLRECTSVSATSQKRHREDDEDLSLHQLISKVKHHKNLPKEFKLPIKTNIENVDFVLYKYVLNQLEA